jgi:Sulfotransferase family
MVLPNFLIIGAAKSGTTTLYECLQAHPQIYMSPLKEPKYFSYDAQRYKKVGRQKIIHNFPVTDLAAYQALFTQVTDERAIGEASPTYLQSSIAPRRIHELLPQVKLIAILREPAARAYSQYVMWYRYQRLQNRMKSTEILTNFVQDVAQGNGGTRIRYYDCLQCYFNLFSKEQIQVYLFDDLKADQTALIAKICDFLQVDPHLLPPQFAKVANKGGIPKNKFLFDYLESSKHVFNQIANPLLSDNTRNQLKSFYGKMRNYNLAEVPPLPAEIRYQLIDIYRQDTLNLQDLIQRDLSHWLK